MSGSSSSPGCSPVPLNWEMSSSSGISMDTSVIGISGKGSPQQLPEALPLKKNFGNLHRILALLCNQQLFRESNLRDPSVIKIICGPGSQGTWIQVLDLSQMRYGQGRGPPTCVTE